MLRKLLTRLIAFIGLALIGVLIAILTPALPATPDQSVQFPPNAGYVNVKDFGARGDGKHDDTQAIRDAIAATKENFQTIYLPNGTYLVSDSIEWRQRRTLQGQSELKTIIKLRDNASGYANGSKPVLRCFFNNNQSFDNYIRNLTVDTGIENPAAIGIQYNTHNRGAIDQVTIQTQDRQGRIGLDLSETEFGPGSIFNVTVEGFDVGIKTTGNASHGTFANITLKNQNTTGWENHFPVSIYMLNSMNSVPAITNSGALAQLVLLEAKLMGGTSETVAIENDAAIYLRDIEASGYKAALKERGKIILGNRIKERISSPVLTIFPSPKRSLQLDIKEPPDIFSEPVEQWVIPDDVAEDDTRAVQDAIDSGAKTLFFPANKQYQISDTIHIRGKVKRMVALRHPHGNLRAEPNNFNDKPVVVIDGKGKEPLTIDSLSISTWPEPRLGLQLSTSRPVYLKYCSVDGHINNTEQSVGNLFIDEMVFGAKFNHPQTAWIRQLNTENNPFNPDDANIPTYVTNNGGNIWILGWKTEAPALHAITKAGGKTEVLGGFFRDHFGAQDYKGSISSSSPELNLTDIPYFLTQDASISAAYVQYAHEHGKARELQATEIRQNQTKELRLAPGTLTVDLYAGLEGR